MAKVARASLDFDELSRVAALARALRCRNSAYFIQYSSFLRLDPEPNPRRDTARDFCHGLLGAVCHNGNRCGRACVVFVFSFGLLVVSVTLLAGEHHPSCISHQESRPKPLPPTCCRCLPTD